MRRPRAGVTGVNYFAGIVANFRVSRAFRMSLLSLLSFRRTRILPTTDPYLLPKHPLASALHLGDKATVCFFPASERQRWRTLGIAFVWAAMAASGWACGTSSGGTPVSGPCDAVDCGPRGACVAQLGAARCVCDPGYVARGLSCVADPCAAAACGNGVCRVEGGVAVCECTPGYGGPRCDTCAAGYCPASLVGESGTGCVRFDPCLNDNPCAYGQCVAAGCVASCQCDVGYAGARCDRCADGFHPETRGGGPECVANSPCNPSPCRFGGLCEPNDTGFLCQCAAGYAGATCADCATGFAWRDGACLPDRPDPCDPPPPLCLQPHREACTISGGAPRCGCIRGYEEWDGQCVPQGLDPCDPGPAICAQAHRQACTSPDGTTAECPCQPGYVEVGDECQAETRDPCLPPPALCAQAFREACTSPDGTTAQCPCRAGYREDNGVCVAIHPCDTPPAECAEAHRAACVVQAGQAVCHCVSGYFEDDAGTCLAIDGCRPVNPCAGRANRVCRPTDPPLGFECPCAEGYYDDGGVCRLATACSPSNPCATPGRGRCRLDGTAPGGFVCDCDAGRVERAGECVVVASCADGDPCGLHGRCRDGIGTVECLCNTGYAGDFCERCAEGYAPDETPGGNPSLCVFITACVPRNPCADLVGQSLCVEDTAAPQGYRCACEAGFQDRDGDGRCRPDCEPANPCTGANRTRCRATTEGEGYACDCDTGFQDHDGDGRCMPDCNPNNPCTEGGRTQCRASSQAPGTECLCDAGFQDRDGDGRCMPDCSPNNPCTGANRTRCEPVSTGNGYTCGCDAGYQDNDNNGSCLPTCATRNPPCGPNTTCDDSSGQALCSSTATIPTRPRGLVLVYDPGARSLTSVEVRGEINSWQSRAEHRFARGADGLWRLTLNVAPGDHGAYKLVLNGSEWIRDPRQPWTKQVGAEINSRLVAPDPDRPLVELLDLPQATRAQGRIRFRAQVSLPADGTALANGSAAIEATRGAAPYTGFTFDAASGVLTVDDQALASGFYDYEIRAVDTQGRKSPALYVPVWLQDAAFDWRQGTIYFVMTDRFFDGDPSNNGSPSAGVERIADWQGGDFAGVRRKIEDGYFEGLGVNVLWLSSPIQNAQGGWGGLGSDSGRRFSGYHSYWPTAAGHTDEEPLAGLNPIEPHFGSMSDMRRMVDAAHARGIRIIADFAANHVHSEGPLWRDFATQGWFHGRTAPSSSQVCGSAPPDPNGTGCVCGWERRIECWFTPYLPDFNYGRWEPLRRMVEHGLWMARKAGFDGFRMDAVKHMHDDFTYSLRGALDLWRDRDVAQRFYMVGETFTGEGEYDIIRAYIGRDKLDGQFDFPLYWKILKVFIREQADFSELENYLSQDLESRRVYGADALMSNFLGNHDVARTISIAAGNDGNDPWTNPPPQPTDVWPYRKLRYAFTFLFAIRGLPLVYQGDEIGMAGGRDPDNRRMMRFDGLSAEQSATLAHVRKLGRARLEHPAIWRGTRRNLLLANDAGGPKWAFGAKDGDDYFVAAFRRGSGGDEITIPMAALALPEGTPFKDVLTDQVYTLRNGQLRVNVPNVGSALLVKP